MNLLAFSLPFQEVSRNLPTATIFLYDTIRSMRSTVERLFRPKEIGLGEDPQGNIEKLEFVPMTGETRIVRYSPEREVLHELRGVRGSQAPEGSQE
jgi:hypothetical protein